jgi:tetratricopeptide (TPR) repeat protein
MAMTRLGYCLPLLFALSVSTPLWSQQQNPPLPPPGAPPSQNPNVQPQKTWSGGMKCSDGKCTSTSDSSQGPDDSPSFSPDATQPQAPTGYKTADDNPFPEALSKAAQQSAEKQEDSTAQPNDAQPNDQGGKDYSSSRTTLKGLDVLGNSPADAMPGQPAYDPKLAAKDDKVGRFYLQTGDFSGAYARYKEASQFDPGDAEAVFGLAEAARQLGKRDEAIQNYQLYIDAFPNGPRAKDIRKALKELAAAH